MHANAAGHGGYVETIRDKLLRQGMYAPEPGMPDVLRLPIPLPMKSQYAQLPKAKAEVYHIEVDLSDVFEPDFGKMWYLNANVLDKVNAALGIIFNVPVLGKNQQWSPHPGWARGEGYENVWVRFAKMLP